MRSRAVEGALRPLRCADQRQGDRRSARTSIAAPESVSAEDPRTARRTRSIDPRRRTARAWMPHVVRDAREKHVKEASAGGRVPASPCAEAHPSPGTRSGLPRGRNGRVVPRSTTRSLAVPVVDPDAPASPRPSRRPAADRISSEARRTARDLARASCARSTRAASWTRAPIAVSRAGSCDRRPRFATEADRGAVAPRFRRGMPLNRSVCRAMREGAPALRAAHVGRASCIAYSSRPGVSGEPARLEHSASATSGIAVARKATSHPEGAGTPAFMAPEQLKAESGEVGRYTGRVGRRRDGDATSATTSAVRELGVSPRSGGPPPPHPLSPRSVSSAGRDQAHAREGTSGIAPTTSSPPPPPLIGAVERRSRPTPPQAARTSATRIVFSRVILRFVVGNIAGGDDGHDRVEHNFEMRMRVRASAGALREADHRRGHQERGQPLGRCVRTG